MTRYTVPIGGTDHDTHAMASEVSSLFDTANEALQAWNVACTVLRFAD